jgi:hypothetical protein
MRHTPPFQKQTERSLRKINAPAPTPVKTKERNEEVRGQAFFIPTLFIPAPASGTLET